MSYIIRLCGDKSGSRVIFKETLKEHDLSDILKEKKSVKKEFESNNLIIFTYKGKRIRLSRKSMLIRDCDRREASQIVEDLIGH